MLQAMRPVSARRENQRGFALLFIFALAGIASVMLYMELPRAVFESQRAKEDLLVYRGGEYQRGLQLYYRKFRKFPQTIEELEKSSGQRFLRKRFVDPMTGKDEWRIVNIVNGQYTNSKVIKPQSAEQKLGSGFGNSSTDPNAQATQDPNDPALKRKASDTSAAEIGGQNQGGQFQGGLNQAGPNAPNLPTTDQNNNYSTSNTAPSTPPPAYSPVGVGGAGGVGSTPTYPSGVANSQSGGQVGSPINAGAPSAGIPGQMQTQNGQRPLTPEQINPALNIIQDLLTRPRTPPPGIVSGNPATNNAANLSAFPLSGQNAALQGGGSGNPAMTGIAGFASKKEGKGIKLINERERIEEWEFIYDPAKDKGGRPNTNMQTQQQQGQQGMQPGFGSPMGGQGVFGGQGGRPTGNMGPRPGMGQSPININRPR
jgi:hypothetical protein